MQAARFPENRITRDDGGDARAALDVHQVLCMGCAGAVVPTVNVPSQQSMSRPFSTVPSQQSMSRPFSTVLSQALGAVKTRVKGGAWGALQGCQVLREGCCGRGA